MKCNFINNELMLYVIQEVVSRSMPILDGEDELDHHQRVCEKFVEMANNCDTRGEFDVFVFQNGVDISESYFENLDIVFEISSRIIRAQEIDKLILNPRFNGMTVELFALHKPVSYIEYTDGITFKINGEDFPYPEALNDYWNTSTGEIDRDQIIEDLSEEVQYLVSDLVKKALKEHE